MLDYFWSPTSAFLLQKYRGACLPYGAVVRYAGILTTLYLVCHKGSVVRYARRELLIIYSQEFSLHKYSEEEPENLPAQVFPPGLLVVHDAPGGGQHHKAKLSGRQQVVGPLLDVSNGHIEPGRDHTTLVQTTSQVHNYLPGSVVINNLTICKIRKKYFILRGGRGRGINHLELSDVAVFHHDGEKPHDDLGAGSEQDLSLASLLSIVHAFKSIC